MREFWTKSDALIMQTWAKQGNAQGITWVAASGDSGGADCYQSGSGRFGPSSSNVSLATDLPASIPEVTGVGGTNSTREPDLLEQQQRPHHQKHRSCPTFRRPHGTTV